MSVNSGGHLASLFDELVTEYILRHKSRLDHRLADTWPSLHRIQGDLDPFLGDAGSIPNIPPFVDSWKIVQVQTIPEDITLYGMSPHMHLHGKDMKYVVTYPDGRDEMILSVPGYSFEWQVYYELTEPLRIPAGSKLTATAHYDNSLYNPY